MSVTKKIGICLIGPLFTAACSMNDAYIREDVEETFSPKDCAGYRTTVKDKMKGQGDEAEVLENQLNETKVIFVDKDCIKENNQTTLKGALIGAQVDGDKEIIKGFIALTAIELKNPQLDINNKRKIINDIFDGLNDGVENIRNLYAEALKQNADAPSQEDLLDAHIADLFQRVETTTAEERDEVLNELIAIHRREKFSNNAALGALAGDILENKVRGLDGGQGLYKTLHTAGIKKSVLVPVCRPVNVVDNQDGSTTVSWDCT